MSEESETTHAPPRHLALPAIAVFLVSMAVIGLELALMRCLAIASWHHFSYLVISTALLGFGASGTLLTLVGQRMERHFELWSAFIALAFAFSVPITFRIAQTLPLNIQYAFYSLPQAGLAILYHALIFIPFLLGALVIGFALMHFSEDIHLVYGSNLVGSGMGGVCMIIMMYLLPATHLLYVVAALGLLCSICWIIQAACLPSRLITPRHAFALSCVALLVSGILTGHEIHSELPLRVDEYKTLATMQRWEADGQAEHRLTRHGPHGQVDVYDSRRFHDTLFAGFTASGAPPDQSKLLINGSAMGTIYRINNSDDAPILDHTPMSLPYRLLDTPKTLLLGTTGGTNIWLARRWDARQIQAVQRNPQIVDLMRGPLAQISGDIYSLPEVDATTEDSRLFLERTDNDYDLIQIVRSQGMAAGAGGMQGMQEDYLLTIEGFALALRRLRPGGMLSITRSTQSPPRDNLKFLFTAVRALQQMGVDDASDHIAIFHNYLSVITLVSPEPFSPSQCEKLQTAREELRLDVDWGPCETLKPSNSIAEMSGPEDHHLSWYHHAASQLFEGNGQQLLDDWVYDIRPATDNSPYFYNFFRWKSVPVLREAFGTGWFRKAEMGYLIVLGTLGEVLVLGAILILLPLLWLRRNKQDSAGPIRGRLPTATYFLLLGVTFMMVEMALIIRFTHFLGDPILSAGGVLSIFLLFTGLGSSLSRKLVHPPARAIRVAVLGIALISLSYEFLLDPIFSAGASWPLWLRFITSLGLSAPLAFLMGWPFPNGLARVQEGSPPLVPWAWSANGFASVAGSPIAVLLAVSHGFSTVMLTGIILYGCAAVVAHWLPHHHEPMPE